MSLRKLLITHSRIEQAIKGIATRIKGNYTTSNEICFIPVLQGSIPFFVDLCSHLGFHDAVIDYIGIDSYSGKNQQDIQLYKSVKKEYVNGKICFIVDDILDSGATIDFLTNHLYNLGAAKVVPVVLLKRLPSNYNYDPRVDDYYEALYINDEWVFGYGMDAPDGTGRMLYNIYHYEKA